MTTEEIPLEVNRLRWRTRRRMAIAAFLMVPAYVIWARWLSPELALGLAGEVFTFCTLVVLIYIGGAVADDWLQKK